MVVGLPVSTKRIFGTHMTRATMQDPLVIMPTAQIYEVAKNKTRQNYFLSNFRGCVT